jgi:hypothetical protein
LEKVITKKNKKNHVGNTVAIHNVVKKNIIKLNSQPAQYQNNKIDKDNFEKNHKKTKKTMWGNTIAIHRV